ncbi:excisionase [Paracidovorax oryzae]|uniref:excisionase n=1 Tax=Paracidovorax oryzae TaxID=862720 RepID=UPI0035D0937B
MSQLTPSAQLHDVSISTYEKDTLPAEWVLASKYQELTGVTRETVKQRKKSGVWKVGVHVGVVKRRLYVNVKAADQWIRDQVIPKPRRA